MRSIREAGIVVDLGSLFARFQTLSDQRKPSNMRYSLPMLLVLVMMDKLCGENHFMRIAEWVKHRAELLADLLQQKREKMHHHSTYRRILAEMVDAEEIEEMSREFLAGKKYFGKQVLLAMDGKVVRGTFDAQQNGTYLLAAYLPSEGIVLMEVAAEGKGSEIPAAPKLLKQVDLREKAIMGDALHTQRQFSIQIVEAGGEYIWFAKGNQSQVEENIRLWFEPDVEPIPGMIYPPQDLATAKENKK